MLLITIFENDPIDRQIIAITFEITFVSSRYIVGANARDTIEILSTCLKRISRKRKLLYHY